MWILISIVETICASLLAIFLIFSCGGGKKKKGKGENATEEVGGTVAQDIEKTEAKKIGKSKKSTTPKSNKDDTETGGSADKNKKLALKTTKLDRTVLDISKRSTKSANSVKPLKTQLNETDNKEKEKPKKDKNKTDKTKNRSSPKLVKSEEALNTIKEEEEELKLEKDTKPDKIEATTQPAPKVRSAKKVKILERTVMGVSDLDTPGGQQRTGKKEGKSKNKSLVKSAGGYGLKTYRSAQSLVLAPTRVTSDFIKQQPPPSAPTPVAQKLNPKQQIQFQMNMLMADDQLKNILENRSDRPHELDEKEIKKFDGLLKAAAANKNDEQKGGSKEVTVAKGARDTPQTALATARPMTDGQEAKQEAKQETKQLPKPKTETKSIMKAPPTKSILKTKMGSLVQAQRY